MPKKVEAAAKGFSAETRIAGLLEEVEGQVHDLRCTALLMNEKIDAAFFPGLRMPAGSDNYYVDRDLRTLIGFVVAMLIEKTNQLDADFQSLALDLRAS